MEIGEKMLILSLNWIFTYDFKNFLLSIAIEKELISTEIWEKMALSIVTLKQGGWYERLQNFVLLFILKLYTGYIPLLIYVEWYES